MEEKFVLVTATDTKGGVSILVGNEIELPEEAKSGDKVSVTLGGKISIPLVVQSFLTVINQLKEQALLNPELKEEDKIHVEQAVYNLVNVSVGGFLDQAFPKVNEETSLTEEACIEYGIDPKTATAQELLDAENKFIEEFPERALKTRDLKPKEIKELTGEQGGPNRKERRKKRK